MKRPHWLKPWLVLFFLSPMIGELLSGSAPPAEFFNPLTLLILCALYGSGAVLAREAVIHWKKGWASLLALGAAYGILEEGLMVKSFFDPHWMDLGPLGEYGRFAGVNWIWSLDLTIYHAVFSISIPVLLTQLLFPDQRDQPWVGGRGAGALSVLLAADVVFGFLALTPYRPPAAPYLLAATLALVLVGVARRLPAGPRPSGDTAQASLRLPALLAFGLASTVGFFILAWGAPNTSIPPLALFFITAAYCLVVWQGIRWMARGRVLAERQRLALASGALGFFILLAPLQQMDSTRADDTAGMALVGLAAALFLLWLSWKTKARTAPLLAALP
jgi:hypothetical protein